MAVEPHDPIGLTLSGGRYTITSKLGEGGMGAVYRARDNNIGADVVIKVPHRSMVIDAEFSRRFRDEVRSLVRLSHPHIVKVSDVGDWDGIPFAVLQFLPGGSLEDRQSASKGPLALVELGDWLDPVARALDYVHSQRLVHRDVKPANILFDEQGHGFLGDFGVVKVLAAVDDRSKSSMTGAGMVLGTPAYMAPELIMGDPFDGRVDQYALAVTVYEMLCGRRPFEHGVSTRVLMMQTKDPVPAPTDLSPWLPNGLEGPLLKALAKAPADRHPSCVAFASAVIEATGVRRGEPSPRARIRCGACGQTIKVAAESLTKLMRAGRTAPCPHCKTALNLSAGSAVVVPSSSPGQAASGPTQVLDIRGGTTEIKAARPPGAGTVAIDRGTGTGTVAIPSPAGSGTVAINTGQGSRTVAIPQPSGTVAINTGAGSKTVAIPRPGPPPLIPGKAAASWLPIGLAAIASAVVVGGGVLWMTSPKRPASSLGPAIIAAVPPPPARKSEASGGPQPPVLIREQHRGLTPPARQNPRNAEAEGTVSQPSPEPGGTEQVADDAQAPVTPGRAGRPEIGPLASRTPAPSGIPERHADPNKAAAGPAESPGSRPDLEPITRDEEQPARRNIPLKKLLADPELHAGSLITLDETYALNKNPWRLPDGSIRVGLLRSDLELLPRMRIREGEDFAIGLDPRLADQLIRLGKMNPPIGGKSGSDEWNLLQPSILHVKVAGTPGRSGGPVARIVRLEMFRQFNTEIINGKRLGVRLATETVTQSGDRKSIGHDDEWDRFNRFGHAYKQFRGMLLANKQRRNDIMGARLEAAINSQVNAAASAFAANQNAKLARERRSLGGP
jgi:serine/threonine-protein kinase